MWAMIERDRVAEITDIDPQGRFHPSLAWVSCDSEVEPGWLYDGSEFSAPEPPTPPVPSQVSRAQGKAALITAGLWSDVLAYVDSIEDETEKTLALVALNDTTHWQRSSPFLAAATMALGLTEAQVDDLFVQASQIQL